jgi:hypothetical protein
VLERLSKRLQLPPFWIAGTLVLLGLALIGFAVDVKYTVKHGQLDLRNRVVGARAMLAHKDPYLYRWQETDPVTLLDPLLTPGSSISKTTVTPAVLALHASFSWLGYREQKFLWLAVQWACFAGIALTAYKFAPDRESRAFVVWCALGLSCTTVWRQHVEAGQIHVVYGALATAIVLALREKRTSTEVVAGALLGLLVTFRPQFALLGLALLLYQRYRVVGGSVLGAGLGLAVPALLSPSVWREYFDTLRRYLAPAQHDAAPRDFWNPTMPKEIEGLTNITSHAPFSDFDSTLAGLLKLKHVHLPATVYLALIALAAVVWLVFIFRDKQRGAPVEFAVARLMGLVLLADLLLPIRRLPYSEAILVPAILLLAALTGRRFVHSTWYLILVCFALMFAFEIRWFALSLLVPPLAVVLLSASVHWVEAAPEPGARTPAAPSAL